MITLLGAHQMQAEKSKSKLKIPNKIKLISLAPIGSEVQLFLRNLGPFLPMPYEPDEHKERKDGWPSPDDDFDRDEERDIPLRDPYDLAAA